ncbi:Pathogenesis-related homeodomain protein, partial [Actinidia chinensis var. chinensis]
MQRDNTELDEPSRLQRRTRYLLIKMKSKQNLIDAYSEEGWKGQSREKIKPEKELQIAKKQILKCKLGIRDAIRQLDFLSSVGHIEDSAIAPDGSVHHEHIICAKCKLREAFPDNDILLCDGTCNCAFHPKCLDPPLLTENIPPGDQGWFCKFCECKMEILESVNAHLGTHFSEDSRWEDIFKEEAVLPDGGGALLDQEQEWPSDDSEDADYDPEKNENGCSYRRAGSEADDSDDASSSRNLWSLEDEVFSESGRSSKRSKGVWGWNTSFESYIAVDFDETTDNEILNGPRQRTAVDYKKLYAVNKWFKNACYIALKSRKEDEAKQIHNPKFNKESRKKGKDEAADSLASKDISSATPVHSPKHLKSANRRKNWHSLTRPSKKRKHKRSLLNRNKADVDFDDDVSLEEKGGYFILVDQICKENKEKLKESSFLLFGFKRKIQRCRNF